MKMREGGEQQQQQQQQKLPLFGRMSRSAGPEKKTHSRREFVTNKVGISLEICY